MGYVLLGSIFAIVLIVQAVIQHKERKDLYNRLMSYDLGEYQAMGEPRNRRVRRNYLKSDISKAYRKMYGHDETE